MPVCSVSMWRRPVRGLRGNGLRTVEMQFLSDLYITCEQCGGERFQGSILSIQYQGKSITDLLKTTVSEALELFSDKRDLVSKLTVLESVGLGYLRLGQPLNTLSGGESQRLKVASHLSFDREENALFILDEPTTGLHRSDVQVLIGNLQQLVSMGNTVVVIEHNLDMMAHADGSGFGSRRGRAGTNPSGVPTPCAARIPIPDGHWTSD